MLFKEVVSKVIDYVILNLFQDPNALNVRPRNKFGVTGLSSFLTFQTAYLGEASGIRLFRPSSRSNAFRISDNVGFSNSKNV